MNNNYKKLLNKSFAASGQTDIYTYANNLQTVEEIVKILDKKLDNYNPNEHLPVMVQEFDTDKNMSFYGYKSFSLFLDAEMPVKSKITTDDEPLAVWGVIWFFYQDANFRIEVLDNLIYVQKYA